MRKKILEEMFGITDPHKNPLTDRIIYSPPPTPGNQNDSPVILNQIPINPFSDMHSRVNPPGAVLNIECVHLHDFNKCKSGCKSIHINPNDKCIIITRFPGPIILTPVEWKTCPCYSAKYDLLGNIQNKKQPTDIYDFTKLPDDPAARAGQLQKPLSGWQYDIFDNFEHKRNNLIVSVPPGGGKTRPIKAYFYKNMIKYLSDPDNNKMPRLIYFVPTKQLSIQIKNNDFIKDPDYGIYSMFSNIQKINLERKGLADNTGFRNERDAAKNRIIQVLETLPSEFEREMFLMKLADSFVTIVSGDTTSEFEFSSEISSKLSFLKNQIKPVIVCVKGDKLTPTVQKYAAYADHIIVDESQELLLKPGAYFTSESRKEFDYLCNVLLIAKKVNNTTKIHLMTGSVNENSLKLLSEAFETYYKLKFEFIPNIFATVKVQKPINDEILGKSPETRKLDYNENKKNPEVSGMKNRSNLTVVSLQALSGEGNKGKVDAIKTIVRSKQTNSIMVVFSSKNFPKSSIIKLMLESIENLPRRDQNLLYDSPAKISIALNADNLTPNKTITTSSTYTVNNAADIPAIISDRESRKEIRKYSDFGTDVRTTDEHKNLIKNRQLQIPGFMDKQREDPRDDKKKPLQVYVDDIEFLKYFNRYELELDGKNIDVERMTMTYDENNLLYQSVLCGIGLMIGKMHPIHKNTIQRLFQKGKIYLLMATDALGVGANVDCKHLYIPTIVKRQDDSFGPSNESSLVQLVNRVGRGVFKNGFVYCREEDYDLIESLINPERVPTEDNRQRSVTEVIPEINVDEMIKEMIKVKKGG